MTFQKGDRVSVLDDDLSGVVTAVSGESVTIETTDGFVLSFRAAELIKTQSPDLYRNIGNLNKVKLEKEAPKPRHLQPKDPFEKPVSAIPEFDLHIEKLVRKPRAMNQYDILTLQTETARRHIEFAIKNRIPKIVLIHGVGEGILKAELDFMLGRYEQVRFYDASFQKYGQGATEVVFLQSVK